MASLVPHPTEGGLWEVRLEGTGGTVPTDLSGRYTHKDNAEKAIALYQIQLQAKLKNQRKEAKS